MESPEKENPLVSVIVPHYEAEAYLDKAIQSVLKQEYSPLEIIIVDSSQSELAKQYSEDYDNIVYTFQEPVGVSAARNHGIRLALGDYIAFLDADDYWLSGKLGKTVPQLSEADAVYSDMYIENSGEREYYETKKFKNYIDFFRSELEIPSRTVVACRYVFDDWMFNEELKAREDPNLWTKLLSKYDFAYVPEATGVKRIREGSLTSDSVGHSRAMLDSYDDLVETFPELGQYTEVRLRYLEEHALNNQKVGNRKEARACAIECLSEGRFQLIPIVVLVCSVLPKGEVFFRYLGRIYKP